METVGLSAKSGGRYFRLGDERGAALVETVFVLPVLLLVVTGITAFGLALNNYQVLTNAVNTGAQALAVSRGQTADPCKTATTAINAAALDLTTASISLKFVIVSPAGMTSYTSPAGTTSCAGEQTVVVQGASAQITATYPCTLSIYGMSSACSLQTQVTEVIQ
jgi:Flp pilus assembly protein TadG